MAEVNLLNTYPNINRDVEGRFKLITEEHHRIARRFGQEFFDGDRLVGYGGYKYDGRLISVVERFRDYYCGVKLGSGIGLGCRSHS